MLVDVCDLVAPILKAASAGLWDPDAPAEVARLTRELWLYEDWLVLHRLRHDRWDVRVQGNADQPYHRYPCLAGQDSKQVSFPTLQAAVIYILRLESHLRIHLALDDVFGAYKLDKSNIDEAAVPAAVG